MREKVPIIIALSALVIIAVLIFSYITFLLPEKIAIAFDVEYPGGVDPAIELPDENQWKVAMQEILFIAKRNDVKFQFNILGTTAEKYPDIIKEIADEGHGVSCHSYSHADFTTLTADEKYNEVVKCKQIVENVTGKKVKGNRFPYTRWDTESFAALDKAEYKWDSSAWADQTIFYVPSGLTEFPIASMHDDWTYFIYQNNTDAEAFYKDFAEDKKSGIYTIVLHPWVQSMDEKRLEELDLFIYDQKEAGTKIASLDKFY